MTAQSPSGVPAVVGAVRRHLGQLLLIAGVLWAAAVVGLGFALGWLVAGPDGWKSGSPAALALDLSLLVILIVAGGLLARLHRAWLGEVSVARSIEDTVGLGQGTVVGALELSRALPKGASSGLASFAERGVLVRLDRPVGALAMALRKQIDAWMRGGLAALAAVVPLVVLLGVKAPDRAASAWGGMLSPLELSMAPVLPPLALEPGNAPVPRGGPVDVKLLAPARTQATLHWQPAGEVLASTNLALTDGEGSWRFESVDAPIRYWAETPDGARSEEFVLTPVDPLFVTDLRVSVTFPPNTGRSPEEYHGDVPALSLPAGARVRIDGRASRPLASAELGSADAKQTLTVDGAAFGALWVPQASGDYAWSFLGEDGKPAELAPSPVHVDVVPDLAPEVRFTYPAADTLLPLNLRQPLVVVVGDDYGVASLEIIAYRVPATGGRGEPVVQRIDLGGVREGEAFPALDVSEWGLLPGDEVRYRARVTDNAPSAQTAETREWSLRMLAASEMRRNAEDELEEAADRVEALTREAARAAEDTRTLGRQAAAERIQQAQAGRSGGQGSSGEGAFQQREDVRAALERQDALSDRVDSLRTELGDLSDAMREAGLADPGLREDLQELQKLLEEISSPELEAALREIERNLETMDPRKAEEALRTLSEAQDDFKQRLEESLERFRQAAAQQDLRATTAEAEELARTEKALSQAMREGGDQRLRAEQQKALAERAQQMDEQMKDLGQRLEEIGETEAAQKVEQAQKQTADAREQMKQAEQSARDGQSAQAGQRAEQAAQSMEGAAQQLQQAQSGMSEQKGQAMQDALEAATQDALALARRQADVQQRMQGASADDMAALRADVGAVLQGVRNLNDNLSETAQQSGQGDRAVTDRAGEAALALQRTLEAMEAPGSQRSTPSQLAGTAVQALNRLAMSAMASARGAQDPSQGEGGDVQQQIESLAQQQGQLNAQTGQIMPMQLGETALQQQLQEVARGQQSVSQELGKLSQQPGAEPPMGLEALAEEARALAQELAGGRLDAQTRQRQERLFHRLLDAGRTLQKEDEISEQRESKTGGAVDPRVVGPLTADDLGVVRYRLPDAATLQKLSPAERQLVIQYFERLNRERPASAPGTSPSGTSAPSGAQPPATPPPGGGLR